MTLWKIAIFVFPLAMGLAHAGQYAQFPGPLIDGSTLRFKQKVEEIYASGNYARALIIYEKELAPQGDKYAQYMTGYMHLTGRGVEPDPAQALAWYRLAAERGESKFIEARDALEETLSPDERQRANELFAELWQRHGDRRILLELVERDVGILREQAESAPALPGTESPAGIASGYSGSGSGNSYHRRVRAQLEERLRYLGALPDDPPGIDDSRMDAIEAELRSEIDSLNLP